MNFKMERQWNTKHGTLLLVTMVDQQEKFLKSGRSRMTTTAAV